jgi:quercetin dioxygenase-like cupin family protein
LRPLVAWSDHRGAVVHDGETTREVYTDLGGTVEAAWVITEAQGSRSLVVGHAVYSGGAIGTRGVIGWHRHPNAEEVVIVINGRAEHIAEEAISILSPGDVCFIPRGVAHAMRNASDSPLEIWWAYGGVSSLEQAGFEELDCPLPDQR